MCPFPQRKIHTLFAELSSFHKENNTIPHDDFFTLRQVLNDRSVVNGNDEIQVLLDRLDDVVVTYNCSDLAENIMTIYKTKKAKHTKKPVPPPADMIPKFAKEKEPVPPPADMIPSFMKTDDIPWSVLGKVVSYSNFVQVSHDKLNELLHQVADKKDHKFNLSNITDMQKMIDDKLILKEPDVDRIGTKTLSDMHESAENYMIMKRKVDALRMLTSLYEGILAKFNA
jgi:hypothetical protein